MWSLVSQARLTLSGSFSSHTKPCFLRDRVDEEGTELRTRRYARSAPDKSRSPALQSSVSTLTCTLTKEARTLELDEEGAMGDTVHSPRTGAPSAVRMANCGFRPNCVDCGSRLIPTKNGTKEKANNNETQSGIWEGRGCLDSFTWTSEQRSRPYPSSFPPLPSPGFV